MAEARTRRIESEIQRVLSELIAREVKDPRVGNVTITAVSLAADMGVAKVFFMPFASQHPAEQVQVGLTRAGGFLRGEVGRRLRLRHAPRLEFVIDDTADKAAHLTGLINQAVASDRAVTERRPSGQGGNPQRGPARESPAGAHDSDADET